MHGSIRDRQDHGQISQWPMWRAPFLEDHSPQNSQSWVLLAHLVR
jgi:hypothetical protein